MEKGEGMRERWKKRQKRGEGEKLEDKSFFLSFRSLHINNIFIFIYIGKNTHDSTGDYR